MFALEKQQTKPQKLLAFKWCMVVGSSGLYTPKRRGFFPAVLKFHCRRQTDSADGNSGVTFSNCGHGHPHLPACHNLGFVCFSFLPHSTFSSASFSPSFTQTLSITSDSDPPLSSHPHPSLCVTLRGKAPLTSAS